MFCLLPCVLCQMPAVCLAVLPQVQCSLKEPPSLFSDEEMIHSVAFPVLLSHKGSSVSVAHSGYVPPWLASGMRGSVRNAVFLSISLLCFKANSPRQLTYTWRDWLKTKVKWLRRVVNEALIATPQCCQDPWLGGWGLCVPCPASWLPEYCFS